MTKVSYKGIEFNAEINNGFVMLTACNDPFFTQPMQTTLENYTSLLVSGKVTLVVEIEQSKLNANFPDLNEAELNVLKAMSSHDTYDEGVIVTAEDLRVEGLNVKQIKGYLSQLSQKSYIWDSEINRKFVTWYLPNSTIEKL